ncbi:hypothetical protein K501DRAFT_280082 [Backusella circina FSU 941]|nr:hypothetical protein K501DRAFT_280082 [Backusella circina FSU 941]
MTILQIKNGKGQNLFGILEAKQTKKLVLIIHGEQGHKNGLYQPLLAEKLPYSSFRFDLHGVGDSEETRFLDCKKFRLTMLVVQRLENMDKTTINCNVFRECLVCIGVAVASLVHHRMVSMDMLEMVAMSHVSD